MNLKEYLQNEQKKISRLSLSEKLVYIAQYYWLWIAGILFVLIFTGNLIYHAFFTIHENRLYLLFTNIMADEETIETVRNDFAQYGGYDLNKENIVINAASYFDASISGGTNNTYFQVFAASVESGEMDGVLMEEDNLKAVGQSGRLLDLSSGEYASLFAPYQDLFVYCIPADESYSTEPVPVGIDLSSSLLGEKYHLYEDGCVLGVGAYTEHPDEIIQFLQFIGIKGRE